MYPHKLDENKNLCYDIFPDIPPFSFLLFFRMHEFLQCFKYSVGVRSHLHFVNEDLEPSQNEAYYIPPGLKKEDDTQRKRETFKQGRGGTWWREALPMIPFKLIRNIHDM